MGIKRYELNDAQWVKVAPLLPGKANDPGRTWSDNRLFVNGCLCGFCGLEHTGATCLSAMVAGRRCTAVSVAGVTLAYGNGYLTPSPPTATTNI
jgi:hypothetical protein